MTQNDQIGGKFFTSLALGFLLRLRALRTPLPQNVVQKITHPQNAREVEQPSTPLDFQPRNRLPIKSYRSWLSAKCRCPVAPDKIKTKRHRQDRDYDHEPFLMFAEYADHECGRGRRIYGGLRVRQTLFGGFLTGLSRAQTPVRLGPRDPVAKSSG